MNITINGKEYSKSSTHQIFSQGRKSIHARNIPDPKGYINKSLFYTELFVHLLGSISELSDYIDPNNK